MICPQHSVEPEYFFFIKKRSLERNIINSFNSITKYGKHFNFTGKTNIKNNLNEMESLLKLTDSPKECLISLHVH